MLPGLQDPQLAAPVDVIEHHGGVAGEALGKHRQRRVAAELYLRVERRRPVDQEQVDAAGKRAQRALGVPRQVVARERVRLERRERDLRDLGVPCGTMRSATGDRWAVGVATEEPARRA